MSDEKQIASAVGHIPSGLFIITAKTGEVIDGYLASWVQQVSFKPLMVALAINPDRPGYETIVSGKTFSINVVGDHDTQFMRHFWSGYGPDNNPFKEIPHKITELGGVAIEAAKSTIDCQFVSKSKPGDHEVVVAKVVASHVHHEESKPKTHIRKSGLDY